MKESHREDLASRSGLEPHAGGGNSAGAAAVRGSAGQPLSSEIINFVCRSCPHMEKATPTGPNNGKVTLDTAESENLSMYGRSKHENRESPWVSAGRKPRGTVGKRLGRYSRHARAWAVRWSHSTKEMDEQTRNPGGGVHGGKGITQGEAQPSDVGLRTQSRVGTSSPEAATAGKGNIPGPEYPREEPYEVVPHVRICAGGRP